MEKIIDWETAKSLKLAGLTWKPKIFDFFIGEDGEQHTVLHYESQSEAVKCIYGRWHKGDLTWIPHLNQMLSEFKKRGYHVILDINQEICECRIRTGIIGNPSEARIILRKWNIHVSDTLDKAVAQALIWILEQEALLEAEVDELFKKPD